MKRSYLFAFYFGTSLLAAACGGSDGVGGGDEDAGDASTSSGGSDGSGGSDDGSGGLSAGSGGSNAGSGGSGTPDSGDLDGAPDSSVTPDGGGDASTDGSIAPDGAAPDAAGACDELETCCATGPNGAACRQIAMTGPAGNCEVVLDVFCDPSPPDAASLPDAAAPPDGGGSGCAGLSACCAGLGFPLELQCSTIAATGIDFQCDTYAALFCP